MEQGVILGITRRGKKGLFQHFRRVPKCYANFESRKIIRTALHTADEKIAKSKAAQIEDLQDLQWEALLAGHESDAQVQYEKLRKLAEARGLSYLSATEVANLSTPALLKRVDISINTRADADAVLGKNLSPGIKLTKLFECYFEFTADQVQDKSDDQLRRWSAPREKAIKNLVSIIGDVNIQDISRNQSLQFRKWWWDRIETNSVSANSGNKDITYLSAMMNTVTKMKGLDFDNPFTGLRFKEYENRRLPFSTDWIKTKLLESGVLKGLNTQARDILLTMINTGARPSEIIGLEVKHIYLDANIPYIRISSEGRALKTKYSERNIPLVGISLEAMRRNPQGFPRYREKSSTWSNTVTKYLRENSLLETKTHTAYSLRHSFSDRLQNAGCEDRTRKEILGHRPETIIYGSGSSLEMRLEWLERIAL